MRIGNIAKIALALSLIVGATLAAPFVLDAIKNLRSQPPPPKMSREANAERFYFEQHLVKLGREPLAWDCHEGSPDQARYFRDACFEENMAEFSLTPENANVRLFTHGDGRFTDANGVLQRGGRELSTSEADTLRALLSSKLVGLPAYMESRSMPAYSSAIEACISGTSFLVIRNSWGEAKFENLADQLLAASHLKATRTSPGTCL